MSYDLPEPPASADDLRENLAWLTATALPIHASAKVNLGEGRTPLLPAPGHGAPTWLKVEGQNPTGSHKDRFHAISAAIARRLGAAAIVTSSTGNHGAASAAYAARAGLGCLILLHPDSPDALRTQLRAYGAHVGVVPGEVQTIVAALVDEAGWYPGTGADPALAGRGNPYGQEGYKAIAYEIAGELGRVPAVVAVPAASGDTVFGVQRGFRELHDLLGLPMPVVLGCQPEGAAPLVLTAERRADTPQVVAEATSAALSARDPRSGWHASLALRDGGIPIAVPEEAIARELRTLGAMGLFVEPASALGLGGLRLARERGLVDPDADGAVVLTSSGLNWTADADALLGVTDPARSADAVFADLRNAGLPAPAPAHA
ncbi:MAG TPA: pyridoxal-phosphate dependent enzyme [Baekduia sp.]|nr:pyridoxal-phosphate dependent enzyme [Baekduia sp.]